MATPKRSCNNLLKGLPSSPLRAPLTPPSGTFLPSMSMRNRLPWLLFFLTTTTTCRAFSVHDVPSDVARRRRGQLFQNDLIRRSRFTGSPQKGLVRDVLLPALFSKGGANSDASRQELTPAEDSQAAEEAIQGRTLLCLVALLYGTLNVSLRLVYQLPDPPSAAALSATRGWMASLCFLPLLAFRGKGKPNISLDTSRGNGGNKKNTDLLGAGLELAIWNFLAQGLLNIGLLSTGSARASFLTQTSVVLTPLISLAAGQSVPPIVWAGCGIALVGLTLLSGVGTAGAGLALQFSTGDWLVLGGALSWSAYLFRLGQIGSRFDEINLQAVKTAIVAVLYSVWLAWSLFHGGATAGSGILSLGGWTTSLVAWGALLYSAIGPGTVADVLQQQGQKTVSASEANVLLSMEPVFAAVCARFLLGEVTTLTESIGGGLILLAALVATRR